MVRCPLCHSLFGNKWNPHKAEYEFTKTFWQHMRICQYEHRFGFWRILFWLWFKWPRIKRKMKALYFLGVGW